MYKEGANAKPNPASLASAAAAALFLLPLSAGASDILRRTLVSLLQVFLSLFFLLLSRLPSPVLPIPIPTSKLSYSAGTTCTSRALSHVLSVVSLIPVSSRKYEIVRSLADRLLDENLRFHAELNRSVLADAFVQTVSRLEATVAAGEWGLVGGAVKKGIKRWWPAVKACDVAGEEAFDGAKAEKLAAELVWIGQKMVESGAAGEAVVRWGAAMGLGHRAISADARLQVALVRVTVFLLQHANLMQCEEAKGAAGEQERNISHIHMAILKSWLPLLCRASNGTETPTLNSKEKAETVRILEELIAKLNQEQQEEVLALWLHHFAACPDSDWPNLESYYARWDYFLLLRAMRHGTLNSAKEIVFRCIRVRIKQMGLCYGYCFLNNQNKT